MQRFPFRSACDLANFGDGWQGGAHLDLRAFAIHCRPGIVEIETQALNTGDEFLDHEFKIILLFIRGDVPGEDQLNRQFLFLVMGVFQNSDARLVREPADPANLERWQGIHLFLSHFFQEFVK